MARKTQRYNWNDGDFSVSPDIALPKNLKSIVAKAPKEDKDIGEYLKNLVADDTITIDEVTFLIETGVLQN
jgi:hypothetical protein